MGQVNYRPTSPVGWLDMAAHGGGHSNQITVKPATDTPLGKDTPLQ